MRQFIAAASLLLTAAPALSQIDQGQEGAWYSYAWTDRFEDSRFGWQGDIQERFWDIDSDLEQRLVRAGGTWTPVNGTARYSLGAAHIRSSAFGPGNADTEEVRLYQEAFLPQTLAERFFLSHRWRLEQRDVEGQDLRNRLRYFIGLNVPLNQATLGKGAMYLAFYNELFVNLERDIGNQRGVNYFDRNRAYAALGYSLSDRTRLQAGYMWQQTDGIGKGQFQLNLFQNF